MLYCIYHAVEHTDLCRVLPSHPSRGAWIEIRDIRKTKREVVGYQAALDETTDRALKMDLQADYEAASVNLKQQRKRYQDLCQQTKQRPDSTRTGVVAIKNKKGQIVSFSQSEAQRSRRTYEKVVKTAAARYNDIKDPEKRIKRYVADEMTKKKLRSDNTVKAILKGKQEKHILGSNNYIAGRSYITISLEEAQELVNKYAGTGEIIRKPNNDFNNREICIADHIIGVVIDRETGKEYPTRRFTIHYAKRGTHVVPAKEK